MVLPPKFTRLELRQLLADASPSWLWPGSRLASDESIASAFDDWRRWPVLASAKPLLEAWNEDAARRAIVGPPGGCIPSRTKVNRVPASEPSESPGSNKRKGL